MPPRKSAPKDPSVQAYRHDDATRKNIPPAGIAAQGKLRETPKIAYSYNPHLPPVLRFDQTSSADMLADDVAALLEAARTRTLTAAETLRLAEALRSHQPWLEWSGKREAGGFEVDPVALHIHERIAAQAILKVAARENVQRSLFADPEQEYREAVQFYQHDVDWANRMILGDSLQVMASLSRREDLAGQVQMIYFDPPYGIRFASNFQPEVGKKDVKDKDSDLTREPEVVRAYRDTWQLGVHSYLAYLRDRLILARELLKDSGSIFVQISDENLHRVRMLLDEVFGPENFVSLITFSKTTGQTGELLSGIADYILWYSKDKSQVKYRQILKMRDAGDEGTSQYVMVESPDGEVRRLTAEQLVNHDLVPENWFVFAPNPTTSQRPPGSFPVPVLGRTFTPKTGYWKTSLEGFKRLEGANRLLPIGQTLMYKRKFYDFPVFPVTNVWRDVLMTGFSEPKIYAVQTSAKVIQRCLLMTTDPGDLVLDPTCGSGTAAFVAEQWGRRWITIDTSRVALALARQRLLTATFEHFKIRDDDRGFGEAPNPGRGFLYKTVPHITLKSIAQNVALDGIFARHQPALDERLAALNGELARVSHELRRRLKLKLAEKEKRESKKSLTDADRRRWLLPEGQWQEWEVPFDVDEEWPAGLQQALLAYRAAWRAKMDEVNAAIAAAAEPEELVDKPEPVPGVVRVSGPFTMEAVMPAAEALEGAFDGAPSEMETFEPGAEPTNAEAFLDKMLRLLRNDGVRFPNNRVASFSRLARKENSPFLHAEGEWSAGDGEERRVAISVGPEHGPVTAFQVEKALRAAARGGYDDLVFAGFSFDAAAQGAIQEDDNPDVRCHLAHIRPDVAMGDLLKETPNSQIFTVFGAPRSELAALADGQYQVRMEGVDIYNPIDNTIQATGADKVAAWFVDTDYDGRTFCITQAFFPDKSAWDKIARALKGVVDEERFAALSGVESLPFPAGQHRRVAVKVIDPRGNEVMRIHQLPEQGGVRYGR